MSGYRVGIDVGGTFTDLICITPDGELVLDKTPTTPDDQSRGVMAGLTQLGERFGMSLADFVANLDLVVHGTTTADNTMIEQTGATTGLLTTEGHRDEIELRRGHKEDIWDPAAPPPFEIARRRARIPIPERLGPTGEVVLALDEDAVRRGAQRLRKLGVTSVAICFLYSYLNPDHELRARELLLEEFPEVEHVSVSHEVLPKASEFERVSTTLVNAYVGPRLTRYLNRLADALRSAGYAGQLVIMQATGGVMTPDYVASRAVTLLGSGPAAGVLGAARSAATAGVTDFVSVDMGGTSYDVGLVRGGKPEIATYWNWRHRYYVDVPMVDVHAVGAGGGSIASVVAGALQVGPRSAGAEPGPACYGRGGTQPTVTDADLVLGYLPATGFAGGRMTLDVAAATEALRRDVADPLGLSIPDAAWGVVRTVNATMADAVRRVLATKGVDPRRLALLAFGGNGGVHAWAQAFELGINHVVIPRMAPAFSALGLLVADYVVDLSRAYVTPLGDADPLRMQRIFDELAEEAAKDLAPATLAADRIRVERYAGLCYPGQTFDMPVPVPPGAVETGPIAEAFHDAHEADRGFAFRSLAPELRQLRVVTTGVSEQPAPAPATPSGDSTAAQTGSRPAYFGEAEFVDTPCFDGTRFPVGQDVVGPALIEEPFTVVVVAPGQTVRLDEHGNYHLRPAR
ncbi:MAG TPA: hydantoinase/oxoprolinase family protein [Mycobacteriales bacterium]|nr:hydantoinase/oxoprolinase family protein [Mycobacteriales bacterium]